MISETIQMQKHLRNIEKEFAQFKKLTTVFTSQHIKALRKELLEEGYDEVLVELVGSVPVWEENYREDIRRMISERYL